MKKIIIFIIVILLIGSICHASEYIKVYINNEIVIFDVQPVVKENRTLVPMRALFENLGCNVEWIGESQTVIATHKSKIIALKIDNRNIIINDVEKNMISVIESDVSPFLYNGRTLIPLRIISEVLGCTVLWDDISQSVRIIK